MGLRGPLLRAATALARQSQDGPDQLLAGETLAAALKEMPQDDPAVAEARDVLEALRVRKLG